MKPSVRNAIALAIAGAVTASAATPTLARSWKPWAAAGAGFVAGAAIAGAANRGYYGPGYGYHYAPSYAYAPGYYDSYAYAGPTVTYETPFYYAPRNYDSGCNKFGDTTRSDYNAAC